MMRNSTLSLITPLNDQKAESAFVLMETLAFSIKAPIVGALSSTKILVSLGKFKDVLSVFFRAFLFFMTASQFFSVYKLYNTSLWLSFLCGSTGV